MAKKVVIVESPAKARTISGYLGKDYTVRASMGHVRDLPVDKFGVDPEEDFNPTYTVLPARQKILGQLKKDTEGAEAVYLAPDPDREGEAIAWHLAEALKLDDSVVKRVTFHEITKKAVREGFETPGRLDMKLVNAQQARRILDRLVGYQLSPLISRKITRGLSAGRVQSVALRLIVEREREVEAFVSQEYWKITALLEPMAGGNQFEAILKKIDGEEAEVSSESQATALVEALVKEAYSVAGISRREARKKAPPPFITSTLQQIANTQLHWSGQQTMRIAQQLYEGIDIGTETVGLITYMRTDSTNVAASAIADCRKLIGQVYGDGYLPERPNRFKSPKGAQAAHEAIRPTDPHRTPSEMKAHLGEQQLRLYKLVWDRFIASQMKPAVYNVTDVDVAAGSALFVARGREMIFDGWMKLSEISDLPEREQGEEEKDAALPLMKEGDALRLNELAPSQHFTQPPPRYTEATLIRALERQGIGRPSTYAAIVSTIQKRNYVRQVRRTFFATPLGCEVTDQLVRHFPRELDVQFTSRMEEDLDEIEEGQKDWVKVLHEFYRGFCADLEKARKEMQRSNNIKEDEPKSCPECGKALVVRFSRTGQRFLGCSGFPSCRFIFDREREKDKPVETEHKCPECGSPMLLRKNRRGRAFLGCSAYPECKGTMGVDKDGNPFQPREQGDAALSQTCEKCGSPMVIKSGPRGRFLACSAYPKCKNTQSLGKRRKGTGEKKS